MGPPQIPTVDVANKKLLNVNHNDLNIEENIDMNLGESDVSDRFIPENLLQESQSHGRQEEAREQHQNVELTAQQLAERIQGPFSQTLKSLVSGKYQYLTYLMSSTACLYFWLAPNHQKMKLIKPVARVVTKAAPSDSAVKSNKSGKNDSKYILYNDQLMKVDQVIIDDAEMEF